MFPEKLYSRACAIDPSAEAFSQWLRWASARGHYEGKRVAEEWHRLRKNDIEPVLFLIEQSEKRNAYPTALSYLEKAERIDPVHSVVRAARLRLLAGGAMRHLQQKKPHLAAEKLAAMEALPQARQGNRPAFLAALRSLILKESGDTAGAEKAHLEAARLLGGDLAARFVVFAIATVSKRFAAVPLLPVKVLGKAERAEVPAALAKMVMVCEDLGIEEYGLPFGYIAEAEIQFPRIAGSLDVEQLRALGNIAVAADHTKLAWAASTEGLKRGGPLEAHFMLLRARAMPARHGQRYVAVAAAAAELGRFHGNSDVVGKAIEIVRNPLGGDSISLTLEQARDVVRKEMGSPAFPRGAGRDPDYSDLMPRREPCQCPECRAARGEIPGPFDDDDDDDFDDFPEAELESIFNEGIPDGVPPELSKALFSVLKEALVTGESPEKIMARIMGGRSGRGKQKKGRRKS
jgi:tetratricopeptide (TPR) repeat protein